MALSQEARDRIVKELKKKTRNKVSEIRQRAAKLLVHLNEVEEEMIDTYIETVLNGSHAGDRDAAAKALIMVGGPAVDKVIDQMVNTTDEENEFAVLVGMDILTQIAVKDQMEKDQAEKAKKGEEDGEESCGSCSGCGK